MSRKILWCVPPVKSSIDDTIELHRELVGKHVKLTIKKMVVHFLTTPRAGNISKKTKPYI